LHFVGRLARKAYSSVSRPTRSLFFSSCSLFLSPLTASANLIYQLEQDKTAGLCLIIKVRRRRRRRRRRTLVFFWLCMSLALCE
jgi:hypothetical protein